MHEHASSEAQLPGEEQLYRVSPERWRILAALLVGGIMGPIDASVVNVSLPVIRQDFGVSLTAVSWVSMAYMLVIGTLLLTFGRLGDMVGHKKIFLSGVALFTVASALCGAAPGLWWLVAARALQAVGAGMYMSVAAAIITAVFPSTERGRALGLNGMTIAAGLALGPSLGGTLTAFFGWRSIFLINVPIGLVALYWCYRRLPGWGPRSRQRFDVVGAVLALLGLGSLLIFASHGQEWGWTSVRSLTWLLTAIITSTAFVQVERRTPQPMLDLSLFRHRVFSAANGASLLNFVAQYCMVFLTPFYLQRNLGLHPAQTGLVMTASPLVVLSIAPFSGALSDRIGTRGLAFAGLCTASVALFLMSTLGPTAAPTDVAWRLAIFGLGMGIFQSPNNSAVMGAAPRHRLGIASAILSTVRNVGMVLGIALAGAILSNREHAYLSHLAISAPDAGVAGATDTAAATARLTAFWLGLHDTYLIAAGISVVSALLCLIREPRPHGS
ncbi:MAG TPA: MFS transporter [Firmicutes bacterium]|nr:MFS transporter [Bacillota bacterium]